MSELLRLSASPHIRDRRTTRSLMYDVLLALLPAAGWAIYRFGWYAAALMVSCVACSVLCEFLYQKAMKQPITALDGSAALTGLLLALNMPPTVPLWIPLLGCVFAILMVKQLFGGLGQNFMNPALAARCFLLISFAAQMNTFSVDGVSGATPLASMRAGTVPSLESLFWGNTGGVIGEVSAAALLLGGAYLLLRRVISWRIPIYYLVFFLLFSGLFGGFDPVWLTAQLFSGGLLLGAFFMATDYVTSPITNRGKLLYGLLLGFLTALFRTFGANPEGVSFAIIIGNMVTPLIEKVTVPRAFGVKKEKKQKEAAAPATKEEAAPHKADHRKNAGVVAILAVITILSGCILGYFYQLTKEPIARQAEVRQQEAYRTVFPEADGFDALSSSWDAVEGCDITQMYTAKQQGKDIGTVVCVTSHEGYGGDISLVVGVSHEGTVTGISFLSLNETAGLGMNAKNPDFTDQFRGKGKQPLQVVKGESKQEGEISAISGATFTSRAVTAAVNAALSAANQEREGGAL